MGRKSGDYSPERMRKYIQERVLIDRKGCWIWQRTCTHNGYGQSHKKIPKEIGGSVAHRVAYIAFNGPIATSLCVCHTCDVPNCVNPGHLFLGTRSINMQDCVKKGRHFTPALCGAKHPKTKLTEEIILCIEALKKHKTRKEICDLFDLNIATVKRIYAGTTWVQNTHG